MLSDSRSESALSYLNGSTIYDDKSILSMSNKGYLDCGLESSDAADLQSFDEAAEAAAVVDSSGSNQFYIRLLVKTISLLQCEEDAERLLLDRLPQRFCDYYLRQLRSVVQQQISTFFTTTSFEEEFFVQSKVLARYISFLLDSVLEVMRRLSVVIKLLAQSKAQRLHTSENVSNTLNSQLVFIWASMEDAVNYEIQIHLVESDVEKISDRVHNLPVSLCLDEDFSVHTEQRLLLSPSSRHASLLFRRVVDYNIAALSLLRESFAIETNQTRPVLTSMQQFLESEFIPLIQSTVNQEIRAMMLDTDGSFTSRRGGDEDTKQPCLAARTTSETAEELLHHYQELFQHRDMVVVVLDRLVRGFLSAAKDHKENILFPWKFLMNLPIKTAMQVCREDNAFSVFKYAIFGGKPTLEEFCGLPVNERPQPISTNQSENCFVSELTIVWGEKYWEVDNPKYLNELNLVRVKFFVGLFSQSICSCVCVLMCFFFFFFHRIIEMNIPSL